MMTTDPSMWTASADSKEVIAAFVRALASLEDIAADARVDAGPMKYKYATLATVLDETRPKLAKEGLVLSQHAHVDGVTTVIFHDSGQWLSFPPLKVTPAGATPQHLGSAISYGRRYAILSICGLATEDDDGRAASVNPGGSSDIGDYDPLVERVNKVVVRMRDLTATDKETLREWADGRSLAGTYLHDNPDWLAEVEAFLDEGLGTPDDDAIDEPVS